MDTIYAIAPNLITLTTLVIFCLTYAGIAAGKIWGLQLDRTGIILLGAIALLATGCTTLEKAVQDINAQSILVLFSLMVIASQLHFAGFYHLTAKRIGHFLHNPPLFLAVMMGTSGLLSAFLNDDVICFAFAPIIATTTIRKGYNPIPFLIALALSSNIGCTLTLLGNAQNVMLSQIAHLNFASYSLFAILPVFLALTGCYAIVYYIARHDLTIREEQITLAPEKDKTPFDRWRTIKGLSAILVLVCLFFTSLPQYLVAITIAGLLLCSHRLKSKKVLQGINWQLLVLFTGLFVVVGTFHDNGLTHQLLVWLETAGIDLSNHSVLALVCGILTNLINNSATVMLLSQVVDFSDPVNGYVLALSNAFAGNLLLIGSMANIIVVQCADDLGINISFFEFAKYGIPTVLCSYLILLGWIAILV